jgi:hypothetical protein
MDLSRWERVVKQKKPLKVKGFFFVKSGGGGGNRINGLKSKMDNITID